MGASKNSASAAWQRRTKQLKEKQPSIYARLLKKEKIKGVNHENDKRTKRKPSGLLGGISK